MKLLLLVSIMSPSIRRDWNCCFWLVHCSKSLWRDWRSCYWLVRCFKSTWRDGSFCFWLLHCSQKRLKWLKLLLLVSTMYCKHLNTNASVWRYWSRDFLSGWVLCEWSFWLRMSTLYCKHQKRLKLSADIYIVLQTFQEIKVLAFRWTCCTSNFLNRLELYFFSFFLLN